MKGNNDLHLNEATIIEAMQQWLDREMPKDTPKVTGVKTKSEGYSGSTFVVSVINEEKGTTP